jgi:hypothetical protein
MVQPYIGQFYSKKWVQKNILMLNDEDIETIEQEMDIEAQEEAEKAAQMPIQADPDATPDNQQQGQKAPTKDPVDINKKVAQLMKGNAQ